MNNLSLSTFSYPGYLSEGTWGIFCPGLRKRAVGPGRTWAQMYFNKHKSVCAFAISQCCLLCASEHVDTWWDETGELSSEYCWYLTCSSFSAVSQVLEGIGLERLKLLSWVQYRAGVEKVRLHFWQTCWNADGFHPSVVTGMCFVCSWEKMRRTVFARRQIWRCI